MAKKYDKVIVEALVSGGSSDRAGFAEAATWLADGSGDLGALDEQVALSAIEAAVKTQSIDRLQSLEGARKALKKAARGGLHKLKSAGITVTPVRQAARFTLGAEAVEHWSTAWLSPPDPEGYSYIYLIWADTDLTGFFLCHGGGGQGILEKDTGLYGLTRSRLRKLSKDFGEDPAMREIPFTTGLHLAQEAFASYTEQTGKSPMDWADFLANVPSGMKMAAQLLNPVEGFHTEVDREALSQYETLERLTGHDWPLEVQALGETGLELMTFLNSDLEISEETREARLKELEVKAADQGLTDLARASIARRLRSLAIYAAAGGQADFASEAWNYHLGVSQGLPAADLPFFGKAAMGSLFMALQSMMNFDGAPDMSAGFTQGALDHTGYQHDHGHQHGPDCDH